MVPVVDNMGMRAADRYTIQELGLPSLVLMEQAASAVHAAVEERVGPEDLVVVLCGRGNNGGDGLAMARQRHAAGGLVEVVLVGEPDALATDAAVQWELVGRFAVPHRVLGSEDLVELEKLLKEAHLVVDALFGTGLDRGLEGLPAHVVDLVNRSGIPVVAVDIPSGLSGNSGAILGPFVEADATVTFAALKWVHLLGPAALHCGEVAVADIGIPRSAVEQVASAFVLEDHDVAGWLPHRPVDAHKGHFGHLLVVAGRRGRAGAAALAARAGVRSGAGLVTVATAGDAVAPIQAQVPEAMVDPLPTGEDGTVTGEGIEACLTKATAVAVGPGLGLGEGPRRLLQRILDGWSGPLLVDADALTLLSGRLQELRGRQAPTVVTPHPGELGRLLGITAGQVQEDRPGWAKRAAEMGGCTVVLKGFHTLVAEAQGPLWVNPTGSPGLASGGSGDVLSGCIGAFLAQGLPAKQAAALGVFLHGRAAEIAAKRFPGAVPASVVAGLLPRAQALLSEPTR